MSTGRGGRADLYALGKILAWLLSGEVPVVGAAPTIVTGTPWTAFLTKLTSADAGDRPASAEEALTLLTSIAKRFRREVAPAFAQARNDDTPATPAQVAALKRYLTTPSDRVRLTDLLRHEAERACTALNGPDLGFNDRADAAEPERRLEKYLKVCSPLMNLVFIGCHFGSDEHEGHWTKAVHRVAIARARDGGLTRLIDMRHVAPLMLMYAGALGAFLAGQARNFAAVTTTPIVRWEDANRDVPLIVAVHVGAVPFHEIIERGQDGRSKRRTPGSDWLYENMRGLARGVLAMEKEYESAFDELELLMALLMLDRDVGWASGRFLWKDPWWAQTKPEETLIGRFSAQLRSGSGRLQPFFKELFNSDSKRIASAEEALVQFAKRRSW